MNEGSCRQLCRRCTAKYFVATLRRAWYGPDHDHVHTGAAKFKKKFEEAMAHNEKVLGEEEEHDGAEGAPASGEAADKAEADKKEEADLAKEVDTKATLKSAVEAENPHEQKPSEAAK